ncbi:leader peptidase (prepilin peptidase)/N-methyltransferase [Paraburkholderia fungorum]|nr:A24 family peptidase [Paraburkholderia fungorum]MBB4517444.1 leader peptidase (prepilin peptidase)/N-methyltransferase [Paraburkholderia fungorum]
MLAGWLPRFLEAHWSLDEERVGVGFGEFMSALARMKPAKHEVTWIAGGAVCLFLAVVGFYAEMQWGTTSQAGAFILFAGVLSSAGLIDLDHQIIPDILIVPLLWAGLLFNTSGMFVPLSSAVYGAAVGYCSMWVLNFLFQVVAGQSGMYGGDFKMYAAIGAWTGLSGLLPTLLIALVAFVLTVGVRLTTRHRKEEMPFGPYLAIGGVVSLGLGDSANFFAHLLR